VSRFAAGNFLKTGADRHPRRALANHSTLSPRARVKNQKVLSMFNDKNVARQLQDKSSFSPA
jgi:hypothetical protein